jgi:hypothetical protein
VPLLEVKSSKHQISRLERGAGDGYALFDTFLYI